MSRFKQLKALRKKLEARYYDSYYNSKVLKTLNRVNQHLSKRYI